MRFNGLALNPLSANEDTTGALFEISGGWAAQTRWQRAGGHGFPINKLLSPEDVASKWEIISNFGASMAALVAVDVLVCIRALICIPR